MDPPNLMNGEVLPLAEVASIPIAEFREEIIESVERGARIAAFFGAGRKNDMVQLVCVLASDRHGTFSIISTQVSGHYESLTPVCEQAHLFEREVFEQWQIKPEGHPWLKPIRFQPPRTGKTSGNGPVGVCGVTDFFSMTGEDIHEVAVGPVHAGIIEPGHFRFQCHGEMVYHLEISLGYQHRGVERAMIGGPDKRTIHYAETLAGDTSVAHAVAYSRAIESLAKSRVSARSQVIRGIGQELERLANHVGDMGALAGDIGFLPTMSYCGRIRGDLLNATAEICGNRFGRGLVRPGGVGFDIDSATVGRILKRIEAAEDDAESAIALLWNTPSVLSRFEGTGAIDGETCESIGLVGVAARACGAERDVRKDFSYGIYRLSHIPISTWGTGDVFARAFVRWLEIQQSFAFVKDQLAALPAGGIMEPCGSLAPSHIVVSLVEGWRGEICHVAITDERGRIANWKIVDPSFHNWFGLAMALRNQQISDFPLCNKSFNLSYCGHDL